MIKKILQNQIPFETKHKIITQHLQQILIYHFKVKSSLSILNKSSKTKWVWLNGVHRHTISQVFSERKPIDKWNLTMLFPAITFGRKIRQKKEQKRGVQRKTRIITFGTSNLFNCNSISINKVMEHGRRRGKKVKRWIIQLDIFPIRSNFFK